MSESKHAGGRPQVPPDERLSEVINIRFRVSPRVADALIVAAMRSRTSLNMYARERLLRAIGVSVGNP